MSQIFSSENVYLAYGILAFGALTFSLYIGVFMGKEFPMKFFRKLVPMREKFGHTMGTAIHFTFYVGLPLVTGLVILFS